MAEPKYRTKRGFVPPVTINAAQHEFVKLVVQKGMNQTEAAKIAWPNNKNPTIAGCIAMKSPGVKIMVQRMQLRMVRVDATNVCYKTLMEVAQDKGETGSARRAAAMDLHTTFGFGRVKDDEGREKALEDMEDEELDNFIEEAEKQLEENKMRMLTDEADELDIKAEKIEEPEKKPLPWENSEE